MEATISTKDALNNLVSCIQSKQKEVEDSFEKLIDASENLTRKDLNDQDKVVWLENCEYLIFQLRVKLSYEQVQIKSTISSSGIPIQVLNIFKQRDVVIASSIQRLNEIRDDVSVIQKLLWTKHNSNLWK